MSDTFSTSTSAQHHAERWSSRILRLGVWISAGLMIIGLFLAALSPTSIVPRSANPSLGVLAERICSTSFDPVTLMFTGLVLLMFTPVLRVITAILGFAVERDWRFVIVSSVVLLMLVGEIIYSMFVRG